MLRLKAERRSLSQVSGASASESLKTPDVSYLSTRTAPSNAPASDPRPHASSRLLRGIRYAILFELVGAGLVIGAWILVGFFANHLSNLTFGLGIVGVGVLFGAMLAVRA